MNTAGAIRKLRDQLGLKQSEFAERLGLDATTISRYENGREPPPSVLGKLAQLADSSGLDYLRDIFSTKQRGDMIARVEKLPSAGSARRIPVEELSFWLNWVESIRGVVENLLKGLDNGLIRSESPQHLRGLLEELMGMAERVKSDIQLHISPRARLTLDDAGIKKLLSQRGPFVNNETPATISERNRKFWDLRREPEIESRQIAPARKRNTKDAKKARKP